MHIRKCINKCISIDKLSSYGKDCMQRTLFLNGTLILKYKFLFDFYYSYNVCFYCLLGYVYDFDF